MGKWLAFNKQRARLKDGLRLAETTEERWKVLGLHTVARSREKFPQRIPRVNGDALFKRAIDFHLQGDLLNAEKCYRGAIACGVLHSALFSNLGVLAATQRMDEAIANYTKAIEINPSNSDPYTNLEVCTKSRQT